MRPRPLRPFPRPTRLHGRKLPRPIAVDRCRSKQKRPRPLFSRAPPDSSPRKRLLMPELSLGHLDRDQILPWKVGLARERTSERRAPTTARVEVAARLLLDAALRFAQEHTNSVRPRTEMNLRRCHVHPPVDHESGRGRDVGRERATFNCHAGWRPIATPVSISRRLGMVGWRERSNDD